MCPTPRLDISVRFSLVSRAVCGEHRNMAPPPFVTVSRHETGAEPMPRRPLGDKPMTDAERQRRRRERLRKERAEVRQAEPTITLEMIATKSGRQQAEAFMRQYRRQLDDEYRERVRLRAL